MRVPRLSRLIALFLGLTSLAYAEVCTQYQITAWTPSSWYDTPAAACSAAGSARAAATAGSCPGGGGLGTDFADNICYTTNCSGAHTGVLSFTTRTGDYCTPEECDPEASGPRQSAVSTVPLGGSVCDTTSNCVLTRTSMATVVGGVEYAGTYENTGVTCGTEPDAEGLEQGEVCIDYGGFEYCTNPTGSGQCGYVNDQYLCLKSIADGGCKVFGDGSRVCEESAGVPPVPDSGTPGDPATPDATVVADIAGSGDTTYNYYSSSTVTNSSRDPGDDGTPQDGTPTGSDPNSSAADGDCGADGVDCTEDGSAETPELGETDDAEGIFQSFVDAVQGAPLYQAMTTWNESFPTGTCPTAQFDAFGETYDFMAVPCDIWEGGLGETLGLIFLAGWVILGFWIVLSS